jgi:hypothetical protein
MKLWLLTQSARTGYDTYDACVVVADTEELAKDMHPATYCNQYLSDNSNSYAYRDWAGTIEDVSALYLGVAEDPTRRVVCASFNAG